MVAENTLTRQWLRMPPRWYSSKE